MPQSGLYLSDLGGFPRAGEPVLLHPYGKIAIGATVEELMRATADNSYNFWMRDTNPNGGVGMVMENASPNGTLAYSGFFARAAGADIGYVHATGPSYTNGALLFVANGYYVYATSAATAGMFVGTNGSAPLVFFTGGAATSNERMRILSTGNVAISGTATPLTSPTAKLHIAAGTTTANTAPLKFNSGSLNSTAEAGAFEFLTDKIYFTITTGAARKEIALADGALTSGRVPFLTTNGRLTDNAFWTYTAPNVLFSNTANSPTQVQCNAISGTAAYSMFQLQIAGAQSGFFSSTGTAWTASGIYLALQANIGSSQSGGLNIVAEHASGVIRLATGGTAVTDEKMKIEAAGNVGIGTQPTTIGDKLHVSGSVASGRVATRVENLNNGTVASASLQLYNDAGQIGVFVSTSSSGYTTAGIFQAAGTYVRGLGSAGMWVTGEHASGYVAFATAGTGSGNERARIDAAGNIRLCGTAALATNATDGFVYMPSSAGAPSGTPTSVTGGVATEIDTTNSKFMAYIGGTWKGVTLT